MKNQPKDIKPVEEHKSEDDWVVRGKKYDADANGVPVADESAIGSPDAFLTDLHKGPEFSRVKVYQVWADGPTRGYVVHDATMDTSKVGYAELAEGMNRAEAEDIMAHAYDNTAILV